MNDIGYKILEDGRLLLAVPPDQQKTLLTILNRALNCWPDAPPEWKHLADILQHGVREPLQNYYEQVAPRTKEYLGQPTSSGKPSLLDKATYEGMGLGKPEYK